MNIKSIALAAVATVGVVVASATYVKVNEDKIIDKCVVMATKMYNNPVSGKDVTLINKNKVSDNRFDLTLEVDWSMYQTVEHEWKCETWENDNYEQMIRMGRK